MPEGLAPPPCAGAETAAAGAVTVPTPSALCEEECPMGFDAWITLGTTAVVLLTLVCTSQPPDLIMIGALTLLLTVGVITPQEALSGFASEGLITVAALFVVATGLRETGGISWIAQCLLGRPKTLVGAQARL